MHEVLVPEYDNSGLVKVMLQFLIQLTDVRMDTLEIVTKEDIINHKSSDNYKSV